MVLIGLGRDCLLVEGLFIAGLIHLGLRQQPLVALQGSLGLHQLGFVRPGIDVDQRFAAMTIWPST